MVSVRTVEWAGYEKSSKADEARQRVDGESRRVGTRERVDGAAFRTRPAGVMQTGAQNWAVEEHLPRRGDEGGRPVGD